MTKIYIAAPLYSQAELDYNLKVDQMLRAWGYDTFLPQRDGGVLSQMPDYVDGIRKEEYVFRKDIEQMTAADIFLFILDGRVPDEGACVALGYCYGLHKQCIGFKQDPRCLIHSDNLMIQKALSKICYDSEELRDSLNTICKSENNGK